MKKIAIHSVPRSGSTWLGSIFDSHPNVAYRFQPLFSYGHKDQLNKYSTEKEINQFFQDILYSKDSLVLQEEAIKTGKVPRFQKEHFTHIVYKEVRYHHILQNLLEQDKEIKVIGLIRNPFAVIYSWLNAPKEFSLDKGWDELDEWRFAPKKNLGKPEEFNGYEKWKEATFLFEKLEKNYPDRFKIVKYKDLLSSPIEVIENIFDFSKLSVEKSTINFIEQSTSQNQLDAYSVFKKKEKDKFFEDKLNPIIVKAIKNDLKLLNFQY